MKKSRDSFVAALCMFVIAIAGCGSGNKNSNGINGYRGGGMVTTIAGFYTNYGSADGVGSAASFDVLGGITIDSAGANLYVSD
jgi:hypothetical protein